MRKGQIKKALKPSERESMTEYTTHFGYGLDLEEKVRRKKAVRGITIAVAITILVIIGFFITDLLIRFTEIPTDLFINPEEAVQWTSSLITHG